MDKPATLSWHDPPPRADRPADDATLIARSRTEPEAFAAIFDRHATVIHRDAGPWLFGIATNMISRHRQAEVRLYRALARVGVDADVASPADEVVTRVAATSQRRAIAAALARHVPVGTIRTALTPAPEEQSPD